MRSRTTLNLDDSVMAQAKAEALRTGRTLTTFIEDAIRQVLYRGKKPAKAEPFDWPIHDLGSPLPGVDLNNSAALLDLMDEDDDPL